MRATIQRWGNSLAVRIPKAFAEQAELAEGSAAEIEIEGTAITLRPARKEWTLEQLLKGITKSNRPKPVDWGPPVGKEVW
jgi:antitoxin MazE